jgi:hypothetical protein
MSEQATIPAPVADDWTITQPGYHALFPEAAYHDDPVPGGSLSSTGARKLLPPGCPAKFLWWTEHREPYRAVFEEGKAAHRKVLGVGPDLVLVDKARWDTNEVKAQLKAIRAAGNVPLKKPAMDMVDAMAAALREDPMARQLLDPAKGATELSLFWRDRSVWGRARPDRLTRLRSGRPVIVDYKTCASAAPAKVVKAIADHGYHVQGAFYQAGARALGLVGEDVGFLLVMQEKDPPHVVTVVEPDPTAMRVGAIRVREAFALYAECRASGRWPGYAEDVVLAELPPWETRELQGEIW